MRILLTITSALKTVSHWNDKKGANVDEQGEIKSNSWFGEAEHFKGIVKEYSSVEDLKSNAEEDLKKHLSNHMYTDVNHLIIMDDGRIDTNLVEDGEGNALDTDERIDFHKNQKPMYLCDYSFGLEIQNVYEPDISEMNGLFPNAQKG